MGPHFSIRTVSQRTGLSAHVIRVWERRYKVVSPKRGDNKHRLYTEQDIRRLSLLAQATKQGYRIRNISSLSDEDLKELLVAGKKQGSKPGSRVTLSQDYFQRCLQSIHNMDSHELDFILNQSSSVLSHKEILQDLVVPLIEQIGKDWSSGILSIAHEHVASVVIRDFLVSMSKVCRLPSSAAKMIVSTPSCHLHELGALIVGVVAQQEGVQSLYTGPNLPAEDLVRVAIEKNVQAIALSVVYPVSDPQVANQLRRIVELLPPHIKIFLGGRAAFSYKKDLSLDSVFVMTDLSEFRLCLKSMGGKFDRAGEL